jgi:hypothetical protein
MQKLKSGVLFLLALVILWPAGAQEKSLLWKVSGNDLAEPSFVFGTMHILCEADFEFPEKLQSALNEVDVLVLELDPTDPELAAEMQQLALNPDMQNIYKDIDEADYALLNGVLLSAYGAGLEQMGILKPMVISSMITMAVLFPCEAKVSIDGVLAQKAKEAAMEIHSLETVAFQMALFDQVPMEVQIEDMLNTLSDEGKAEFEVLKRAYLTGDVAAMDAAMADSDMMETYGPVLLSKRNQAWMEVLPDLFQKQSNLVAVGAGHLTGEDGLLELLKEAGYKVEPVY